MKNTTLAAAAALALLGVTSVHAVVVIDTVYVGDAGNPNDPTTGYGSVSYGYNIGKYEVTIGQYTEFLNAVAATDTYGLYNTSMGTDRNVAGIAQIGLSGRFIYSVLTNGENSANRPISYVSWFDAARFSNWMANGQGGPGSTETGAYTLNGAMSGIFTKNAGASWYIPTEDEWYKAAYYSPGESVDGYWLYPMQSDNAPGNTIGSGANQANFNYSTGTAPYITNGGAFSGSASHYGTYDQGGNVWEWNDAVISGSYRGLRGASWDRDNYSLLSSLRHYGTPANEFDVVGFRIANVPEPSAAVLVLLAGSAGWWAQLNRKRLG